MWWLERLFNVYGCSEEHRNTLTNEVLNSNMIRLEYKIAACQEIRLSVETNRNGVVKQKINYDALEKIVGSEGGYRALLSVASPDFLRALSQEPRGQCIE